MLFRVPNNLGIKQIYCPHIESSRMDVLFALHEVAFGRRSTILFQSMSLQCWKLLVKSDFQYLCLCVVGIFVPMSEKCMNQN